MHPDSHYISHTSKKTSCHRKKKLGGSGFYGSPYAWVFCRHNSWQDPDWLRSECDSPLRLTNFTFDYLESNWASEIDFVVCECCLVEIPIRVERIIASGTGDNVRYHQLDDIISAELRRSRHDNDDEIPRTPAEMKDMNSAVAMRMKEVFLNRNIPVVPSLGMFRVWHNLSKLN